MARQPIDIEMRGGQTLRERIWDAMLQAMRKAGGFTTAQISEAAHPAPEDAVSEYLTALRAAGIASIVKPQGRRDNGRQFTNVQWRLDTFMPVAPRITSSGKPVMVGMKNLAMWRAAKVRKEFTPSVLARDASIGPIVVSLETAKKYCLALTRSGHFKMLSKGRGGIESSYRLVNDTGPHAPCITRAKAVYDRNCSQLHLTQTAQEALDETAA